MGGETRMVRRGAAPLPPNCWNDIAENREGMAAAIREALGSAGITARSVVACLPRRLVTVRFARLPNAPPEQRRGMIELEAQEHILFPLNEVMLDYHVPTGIGTGLSVGQDDLQTVLLAAARRSLVADIVQVFDRVGVELARLSVSALALAEHIRDSLEPTAIIALESGAMDVSVVADGQLLFTRSSALEVAGIAREVAARRFAEEVARSFTAYQNEFRQKPLAHIYLCGSETASSDGDWMDQALVEALEKPVARLHTRLLPASDPDATSFATATGMALQALGGALSDINLVPNDRAIRRQQVQQARRKQLIGLVVAACVVAGGFFLRSAMDAQEVRRKLTVTANAELEDAQKAEKPVQRSHDRVVALNRILTKSLDRDHPSVDVLVALNRSLPRSSDIWLTQLNFDRSGLMTLRGDSKNARAVTDLLLNLQTSGAFSEVTLSYLADAQDTATGPDVVQVPVAKPPITPLPGLPQPVAPAPTTPGVAAAPGSSPVNGASTPMMGGQPGYGGGFNPGNLPGGFARRRFGGGGFGGPGGPAAFGGPQPGSFPGSAQPGTPQVAITPGQAFPNGAPALAAPTAVPGQASPTFSTAPAPGTASPQSPVGGPQGSLPGVTPGRVVITPDMGAGPRRDRGGFGSGGPNAWRQFRNGVTPGAVPSSVNMAGTVPGAATSAVNPTAPPVSAPAAAVIRKPAPAKIVAKPTLTGFVITCRLRPTGKLIPPGATDTVRNGNEPVRIRSTSTAAVSHGDTDNTDDTGDIE